MSVEPLTWIAETDSENPPRLDRYLSLKVPERSRTWLQTAIKDGKVTHSRNGEEIVPVRANESVLPGDSVSLVLPAPEAEKVCGEELPLSVVYEDDYLLIIDKIAGMVVHPGAGVHSGTVVNALLGLDPERYNAMDDGEHRPGIVHRIDKETSGLLIVAKDLRTRELMMKLFAQHKIEKTYVALVRGVPAGRGLLKTLITRSKVHRQRMEVTDDEEKGKVAITRWKLIADSNGASLIKVRIETGRTHQIRVHMAHQGFPVIGDKLYGNHRLEKKDSPDRHLLHAWRLAFTHPITNKPLVITCPVPADFLAVAAKFGIDIEG